MTTRVRKRLLMSGGLALVVCGLLTAAYHLTFFSTTQIRSTDFLFKSRTNERARSTVIVGIDQRSYRTLLPKHGAMSNWPRTLYSDVVHALQHAGARVIAFDIFFDAPRAEDSELASVFEHAGNIILPVEAQGPGRLKPDPGVAQEFEVFFRSTETIRNSVAAEGFVNVTTDADTVVRSLPLVIREGSEDLPTLSLTSVAKFIRRPAVLDAPSTQSTVFGAGRAIPILDTYSMLINFLGPPSSPDREGPFTIIPFIDILDWSFS